MTTKFNIPDDSEPATTVHLRIVCGISGKWYICDEDITPGGFDTADAAIKFCNEWSHNPKLLNIQVDTGNNV